MNLEGGRTGGPHSHQDSHRRLAGFTFLAGGRFCVPLWLITWQVERKSSEVCLQKGLALRQRFCLCGPTSPHRSNENLPISRTIVARSSFRAGQALQFEHVSDQRKSSVKCIGTPTVAGASVDLSQFQFVTTKCRSEIKFSCPNILPENPQISCVSVFMPVVVSKFDTRHAI